MRILYVLLIGIVLFAGCKPDSGRAKATATGGQSEVAEVKQHFVIVKEIIQTTQYTYLKVTENNEEVWIAISKANVKIGAKLAYSDYLEMRDFKSKELDRTFEKVLFIQNISGVDKPGMAMGGGMSPHGGGMMKKPGAKQESLNVKKAPNGITIGELFKNKDKYNGKKVIIRAKVVKVNMHIMNLNWIHLQDGTKDGENFDLTVTTDEEAEVGDTITIEGKVVLNKDFGAGYSYDLIIQEAVIK